MPDPTPHNSRPDRIHGQIPGNHNKTRNQRQGNEVRSGKLRFDVSENQASKRPGQIPHSHIRKPEQDWYMENLWTHNICKVIVPEGKAGENAEILEDVPY